MTQNDRPCPTFAMSDVDAALERAIELTGVEPRPPGSFTADEYREALTAKGLPAPTHRGAISRLERLVEQGVMAAKLVRGHGPMVKVFWFVDGV